MTNRQTDTRQCAVKTCFSCLTWSVFRECVHVETLQKLGPLNFKIKTHLTSCTSLQSTNSAVGRRLDDVEETRAKSGCWHNQPFACLEPHIIRIVCYCCMVALRLGVRTCDLQFPAGPLSRNICQLSLASLRGR